MLWHRANNYGKEGGKLADAILGHLKAKKARDVAAELLMLGPNEQEQKKQKTACWGDVVGCESDVLYSDETWGEAAGWWTE